MLDKYKNFIKNHISLNPLEWMLFKSKLQVKYYKKGDIIHYNGDICSDLLFIDSGLAKAYIIEENGKDHTWSIFFNDENSKMINLFATDYASFINQTPSMIFIEALQDSTMVSISYESLQSFYAKSKQAERFGRIMGEIAYSYVHNSYISQRTKSATDRFYDFMEQTPYLLDKVPQYDIATMLGITPQHLSRLKASMPNQTNNNPNTQS